MPFTLKEIMEYIWEHVGPKDPIDTAKWEEEKVRGYGCLLRK